MSDLQHPPTLQQPAPTPPGPRRGRLLALVAAAVVVLLAVVLAVVYLRPTAGTSGNGSPSRGDGSSSPSESRSTGSETSAGTMLNWGTPVSVEEFDGSLGKDWQVYDGEGHDGNGRRSPSALSFSDGIMTITGDSEGKTAGMAWVPGRKYGRWEGRVKAPVGDETYNALMLLWPDKEDWPVGGEVDFMEMDDPTRQNVGMYLHYGRDNSQDKGFVKVDATEWHNWAVEWTPDRITCYLDGKRWYTQTDKKMFPPRPMHLAIQLDWFPENGDGDVTETTMEIDWVKEYALPGYE